MFDKNKIDIELLKKLTCLDPETGIIFWLARDESTFPHLSGSYLLRAVARWNTLFAGREALPATCQGYKRGLILGIGFYAHHVAWALHHGDWCPTNIDHINGDKTDNRPANLRAAAHEANARNQKLRSSNTSGVMGVSWSAQSGAWIARINAEGERKYLGQFSDFGAAVTARKQAEAKYGYDPTHGRRAA